MIGMLLVLLTTVPTFDDFVDIWGYIVIRKGAYMQELVKKLNRAADSTFSDRIAAIGMPCELMDETIAERNKITQKLSAKFTLYPIELEMNSFGMLAEIVPVIVLKETRRGDDVIPPAMTVEVTPLKLEAVLVGDEDVVASVVIDKKATMVQVTGIDTTNIVDGSKFSVLRLCTVDGTHKVGSKKMFRIRQLTQKEHDTVIEKCEKNIDEFLASDEAKEIGKILSGVEVPLAPSLRKF